MSTHAIKRGRRVEDCRRCGRERPLLARWLCASCYAYVKARLDVNQYPPMPRPGWPDHCTGKVAGTIHCTGKVYRFGLCWRHYRQSVSSVSPEAVTQLP